MTIKEKILETQINQGVFENSQVDFAEGIAKLAIDKGFNTLTVKQQAILEPYLSIQCSGFTDPGGHHNNCEAQLEEETLLSAYDESDDSDSPMCESCRSEVSYIQYRHDKLMKE